MRTHHSGSAHSKRIRYQKRGGDVQNIAQQAYDTTATIGQAMSWVYLIFGVIVGLILIVVGFALVFKKESFADTGGEKKQAPPAETTQSKPASVPYRTIGIVLIIIGFLIIIASGVWFWLVRKSKVVAALTGADAVVDLGQQVFE